MNEYIKSMRKKIGHDRLAVAGAGVFIYEDGKCFYKSAEIFWENCYPKPMKL